MSPAAPEATNRASTTPRSDGVARLAGRGGEVATATGRTPRRSVQTRRRLPDAGPTRQATVHSPRRRRGQEPFGRRRRPIQQTPTSGGWHAASAGGGWGGAGGAGGGGRVLGGRGRRRRGRRRRWRRVRGPGGPGCRLGR